MRILFLSVLLASSNAFVCDAATISVNPTAQTQTVGSPTTISLLITGLGAGTAPSLGTFDIDIAFDPVLLSFVTATFGNQLDILGLGSLQITTPGTGTVNLFELSLDTVDDLNNLQAGSFTLAMLTFDTIAVGTSALNLTVNALGDADGQAISSILENGTLTIEDTAGNPIPEPSYALPIGSLLLLLLCAISSRRQASHRS